MPRHPLVVAAALTAALLTVSACSSGGGDTASEGGKTSPSGSPGGTHSTKPSKTKLVKVKSKGGGVSNTYAKTASGAKISIYAVSPGHTLQQQTRDPDTKEWSKATTIYSSDTAFCHSAKLKSEKSTIAGTVTCSISAQDVDGTQSSFILASNDGKTWKRLALPGAGAKPIMSPTGAYVAWSAPKQWVIWNPKGVKDNGFVHVQYTQDPKSPTIAVMQDNGQLLMVKATPGRKKTCTVTFRTASVQAPKWRTINTTLPLQDHHNCAAKSGKLQGTELVANFTEQTATDSGDKKTTVFAVGFHKLADGKWVVKTS